ncbi:MAG: hypothetical protein SGBAC_011206 [Bacillariaceae sp.]
MKVLDTALSLFLLLGSEGSWVFGFQAAKQLTPTISGVNPSSYQQSNVAPHNKMIQRRPQRTVGELTGLCMNEEGNTETDADIVSESSSDDVSEVKAIEDDSGDDATGETESPVAEVAEESSESESESETAGLISSPETSDASEASEASETAETAEAALESQAETTNSDPVAFFASKAEPTEVDGIEDSTVSDESSSTAETVVPVSEAESEETSEEAEMSVKEILEVAEEMKEMTETLPEPVKPKPPTESPMDSIKKTSKKVIEFISSPPPPPPPKTENDEKIDVFVQALGEVAKGTSKELAMGILGSLRMTAANALTQSLPDTDRAKLLERITVPSEEEENEEEDEEEDEEDIRASVAEEIAAAKAEQARRSEEMWESEKEALVKKMEEAANARVENELAIQKERLVNEMKEMVDSLMQSKQQLEDEKTRLAEQLIAMDKRVEDMKAEQSVAMDKRNEEMKVGSQQVDELQSIIDKREKQKVELAKVEDSLRVRLEEIETQKKLIADKSEALQTAESEPAALEAPKAEEESDKEEVTTEVETKEEQPKDAASVHPVLGPMVCDMGYKRIYLTSSETLGTLPIWKKQRIYRHSRARSMALDKAKNMGNGFPGAIGLAEDSEGNLSVLDGQHRIGMMQLLREMENDKEGTLSSELVEYFDKVLVEVFPNLNAESLEDDKHAESVFLEINKAEPVKLVDMPGVASARDNKIITQAVQRLEEQFPKMFSASQKCLVPNVNIDNMRNNIFGANIMKRHRLRSGKQLFDWLLVQNAAVGASYELDPRRREAISESAWQKASANAFYLGLESSWLYM